MRLPSSAAPALEEPPWGATQRVWPPSVPSPQAAAWFVFAATERRRVEALQPTASDMRVTFLLAEHFRSLPHDQRLFYEDQAYSLVVRARVPACPARTA